MSIKRRRQNRRRAAALVLYGGWVLVCSVWQSAPHGWPTLCGGRPLLAVPLCAAIGMFTGPFGGGAAGIAAGLFWGAQSAAPHGFHAGVLLIIAVTAGLLVRFWLRNNVWSALLICGGAVLIYAATDWLCLRLPPLGTGAFSFGWHTTLPCAVYTLVLSLPIYGAVRGVAYLLREGDERE